MPKGPQGQKRPADVIGNAVLVAKLAAKLATGEASETHVDAKKRKGGKKGGRSRATALDAERRTEIARGAARRHWSKGEQGA